MPLQFNRSSCEQGSEHSLPLRDGYLKGRAPIGIKINENELNLILVILMSVDRISWCWVPSPQSIIMPEPCCVSMSVGSESHIQ